MAKIKTYKLINTSNRIFNRIKPGQIIDTTDKEYYLANGFTEFKNTIQQEPVEIPQPVVEEDTLQEVNSDGLEEVETAPEIPEEESDSEAEEVIEESEPVEDPQPIVKEPKQQKKPQGNKNK